MYEHFFLQKAKVCFISYSSKYMEIYFLPNKTSDRSATFVKIRVFL